MEQHEINVLKKVQATQGRYWKADLSQIWSTGNFSELKGTFSTDEISTLQRIRNKYGPSILYKKPFKDVPGEEDQATEEEKAEYQAAENTRSGTTETAQAGAAVTVALEIFGDWQTGAEDRGDKEEAAKYGAYIEEIEALAALKTDLAAEKEARNIAARAKIKAETNAALWKTHNEELEKVIEKARERYSICHGHTPREVIIDLQNQIDGMESARDALNEQIETHKNNQAADAETIKVIRESLYSLKRSVVLAVNEIEPDQDADQTNSPIKLIRKLESAKNHAIEKAETYKNQAAHLATQEQNAIDNLAAMKDNIHKKQEMIEKQSETITDLRQLIKDTPDDISELYDLLAEIRDNAKWAAEKFHLDENGPNAVIINLAGIVDATHDEINNLAERLEIQEPEEMDAPATRVAHLAGSIAAEISDSQAEREALREQAERQAGRLASLKINLINTVKNL